MFIGLIKWICVFIRFVGWIFVNLCIFIFEIDGILLFVVLIRLILFNLVNIVKLCLKFVLYLLIIIVGFVVNGLVFIVLMKIEDGVVFNVGILLNGWVCNVVYKLDFIKFCFICLVVKEVNWVIL